MYKDVDGSNTNKSQKLEFVKCQSRVEKLRTLWHIPLAEESYTEMRINEQKLQGTGMTLTNVVRNNNRELDTEST